jgi:hypothetical protein
MIADYLKAIRSSVRAVKAHADRMRHLSTATELAALDVQLTEIIADHERREREENSQAQTLRG